ncbi:putative PB1 domain-containing protein [Lupinus albus]|uniref:Putative PB1 domain-containing protein n=1 Tax=Lupinus albus TaxID=3870 RepID=A0A6A4PIZ6_LUPAL|nr:putative PB1 domain-containing protein [Lupinus albus]
MEHIPKATSTAKFLCSYGGKILPRATDGELRYCGGHTRVLAVDRSVSFSELIMKVSDLCGFSVTLKCPLPNGNLETLISITSDEDLANIIEEYKRTSLPLTHPLKIRTILSPLKKLSPSPSSSSCATHSSESPPCAVADQIIRRRCSPAGYQNGFGYGSVNFGSPRFLNRGSHYCNYCH